jgi:dihydropteroate synthase
MELGRRTYIMAIVNLTADSFSGDGTGDDIAAALRKALDAIAEGADIIDVGAESARADVPVQHPDREAQIVGRTIGRIANETGAIISVDTYKGTVAEAAMQAGAHIINDIGGFKNDTSTAEVAAKHGAALVVNYTFERPKIRPLEPPRYDDVIAEHLAFLRERVAVAEALGVPRDTVIVDPGIAFGKSHDEDLQVLRRLNEFTSLQAPLMIAASRKHFIGSVLGLPPQERDEATVAITALSIAGGADIVRVHDARSNVRAARIADAIVRAGPGAYASTDESWPWASNAQSIPGTKIGDT